MTIITVVLQGETETLRDAIVCAVHHSSKRRIVGEHLIANYIVETDDYDEAMKRVMDSIDINQAELIGCKLICIG